MPNSGAERIRDYRQRKAAADPSFKKKERTSEYHSSKKGDGIPLQTQRRKPCKPENIVQKIVPPEAPCAGQSRLQFTFSVEI